ncbi:MAG TPA: MMPL family transporter [Dehalococcoidia bacterium]
MKSPTTLASALVQRQAVALIVVAMAAALALSFGIPRLQFKTGQETLIDPNSKVAMDNERFQSQFGGDPMLILFEAPDGRSIEDLFSPANRAELDRFQRDLEASGQYQGVITPLLILELAKTQIEERMVAQPLKLASDQDAADAAARAQSVARGETSAQQDAAAAAARQRVADEFNAEFGADARRFLEVGDRTLDNPKFVEFVLYGADGKLRPELSGIFPDDRHALMVVRLRGNLSIDDGSEVAAGLVKQSEGYHFDGVTMLVSGPPLLIKEINDAMRSSLAVMAVFAVLIMAIVLSVIFRARWRLLSLPAVLVGCVAAFGLMGFAGIPLTMVTISGLPILIGLGVDFAIQAHSRIEEETFATESAEAGIERTFARLGPALTVAALAACIGFAVLHLSDVPMIRDFGTMLAVGAIIVFVTSITLISAVVFLRERTRIGPQIASTHPRFEVERIVGNLTSRTVGRLAPIALVAAVVAVGGLYVSRKIPTETDPEKFVPANSSVLVDLHRVRDVAGSTSELNLLVETSDGRSVLDQDVLDWMAAFEERQKDEHSQLGQSNSVASLTQQLTGSAPTTASAQDAMQAAPRALVDSVISPDGRSASITFAIGGDDSLDERKQLTQAVENDARAPDGVTIAPAGIAVIGTASVDALSANRDLMSFVAIAAIFVALLAVFRSPVKAVAPLLPVVLALGASAMMLYAGGISYSPLTSISGPLIIAMGTEFNILLMSRYFEERATGVEPRDAMALASRRIGRAIMASGLTMLGGFAVLAFSDFSLLDNFGKVTALNIGVSLLSTLILLPPLLVWADEDRHFVGIPDAPSLPER